MKDLTLPLIISQQSLGLLCTVTSSKVKTLASPPISLFLNFLLMENHKVEEAQASHRICLAL
jgi:hypothetical protein